MIDIGYIRVHWKALSQGFARDLRYSELSKEISNNFSIFILEKNSFNFLYACINYAVSCLVYECDKKMTAFM